MELFAWFGEGIGRALVLSCHFLVGLVCLPLVVWMIATWPAERGQRRAWVSFVCIMQTIPVQIVLHEMDVFSPYFGRLWLLSLMLVVVGVVVKLRTSNQT